MSELKQARADFEEYLGLKPLRWKDGMNGGTYHDYIIENRWQDFLHGYTARRTQPEATKPAQDLSAAILALPLPEPKHREEQCIHASAYTADQMRDLLKAAAALASPADALVAGDRVDAEVERLQAEIMRMTAAHAIELHRLKKQAVSLCERIETGASIDNDKRPSDYKQGIIKGAKDCALAIAAIQAQKDGHD